MVRDARLGTNGNDPVRFHGGFTVGCCYPVSSRWFRRSVLNRAHAGNKELTIHAERSHRDQISRFAARGRCPAFRTHVGKPTWSRVPIVEKTTSVSGWWSLAILRIVFHYFNSRTSQNGGTNHSGSLYCVIIILWDYRAIHLRISLFLKRIWFLTLLSYVQ